MAYANYPEFREAVMTFIVGDEPGSSTAINTQTVDTLIRLGESRVYYGDDVVPGLRSRLMLYGFQNLLTTAVDSGNNFDLPEDCLEIKEIFVLGKQPLEVISIDRLRKLEASGTGGDPQYVAWDGGDKLRFFPDASGSEIDGKYYRRFSDSSSTWGLGAGDLVNKYPELFIYAALAESAPFLGEDDRLPMWISMFRSWMKAAQRTEQNAVYGGSPLRMRAR